MTHEEHTAIDEQVGREVFGLETAEREFASGSGRSEIVWVKYGLRDDGGWIYAGAAVERIAGVRLWGPDVRYDGLPKFSSSYAAAWAIFVWLTERYGGVGISSDMEEWTERAPVIVTVANPGVRILWEPLQAALCHAALACVRKEPKE